MSEVKGNAFNFERIAKLNIGKKPKFVYYGDLGIMALMALAVVCYGICYGFNGSLFFNRRAWLESVYSASKTKPSSEPSPFVNAPILLVLAGFLYIVVVEGKGLMESWNRSIPKKKFLTIKNVIGLGFLVSTAVLGAYATYAVAIGVASNLLPINFLGIFGIIWTLTWIQRLKNFSPIRDNVHKLIGPLIAITILICGYVMHDKGTISSRNPHYYTKGIDLSKYPAGVNNIVAGPLSCILAPVVMWVCSLIFGDIEGGYRFQNDSMSPFAVIISAILLAFVTHAIRNPDFYGMLLGFLKAIN